MSPITRAFTTKRVKLSLELAQEARERAAMQRSNTTKAAQTHSHSNSKSQNQQEPARPAYRPKISGPLELIHTTNMLSYNAPDLPRPSTSSEASVKSDTESESGTPTTAASSPPTSPDVAPEEMDRCVSPEPNHLSCYFMPPTQAMNTSIPNAPAIPKRAPSHTKKASFEALTRQRSVSVLSKESGRSVSTKASFTFSRASSASTTTSTMSHNSMQLPPQKMPSTTPAVPAVPSAPQASEKKYEQSEMHPFGQELAQVSEIAEEFGVGEKLDVIDEEEQELVARGLCKFSADAYLRDIENLLSSFFHDRDVPYARPVATVAWI